MNCSAASRSKKNNKKMALVPPPPKKALSAYNLFFQCERKRLLEGTDREDNPITAWDVFQMRMENRRKGKRPHRKTHGKIGFRALALIVAERWKRLDPRIRAIFEEQALQEKNETTKMYRKWQQDQQDTSTMMLLLAQQQQHSEIKKNADQETHPAGQERGVPEYVSCLKSAAPAEQNCCPAAAAAEQGNTNNVISFPDTSSTFTQYSRVGDSCLSPLSSFPCDDDRRNAGGDKTTRNGKDDHDLLPSGGVIPFMTAGDMCTLFSDHDEDSMVSAGNEDHGAETTPPQSPVPSAAPAVASSGIKNGGDNFCSPAVVPASPLPDMNGNGTTILRNSFDGKHEGFNEDDDRSVDSSSSLLWMSFLPSPQQEHQKSKSRNHNISPVVVVDWSAPISHQDLDVLFEDDAECL